MRKCKCSTIERLVHNSFLQLNIIGYYVTINYIQNRIKFSGACFGPMINEVKRKNDIKK